MSSIPTNNRFLDLTPEKKEKIKQHLLGEVARWTNALSSPGEGEPDYVRRLLGYLQDALKKFKEFGYDVNPLGEEIFPELTEAIGVLKRGGLDDEIRRIMTELLVECNLPERAPDKK
jgi:hypothetical protein